MLLNDKALSVFAPAKRLATVEFPALGSRVTAVTNSAGVPRLRGSQTRGFSPGGAVPVQTPHPAYISLPINMLPALKRFDPLPRKRGTPAEDRFWEIHISFLLSIRGPVLRAYRTRCGTRLSAQKQQHCCRQIHAQSEPGYDRRITGK
jgi:hypothetical protein